jgi:hypothetical protein
MGCRQALTFPTHTLPQSAKPSRCAGGMQPPANAHRTPCELFTCCLEDAMQAYHRGWLLWLHTSLTHGCASSPQVDANHASSRTASLLLPCCSSVLSEQRSTCNVLHSRVRLLMHTNARKSNPNACFWNPKNMQDFNKLKLQRRHLWLCQYPQPTSSIAWISKLSCCSWIGGGRSTCEMSCAAVQGILSRRSEARASPLGAS